MGMTDWERTVTKIADQYGLVYERPTGGRNHGKLRDPITDKFKPVSCSPRDDGRAAIHVNNDARRLVALRPKDDPQHAEFEEPSTNGDMRPDWERFGLVDVEPEEIVEPEPVADSPARSKRRIKVRNHDDKKKRQLLADITAKVAEIDDLERWQKERRVEVDELVVKGRKLGISLGAMSEAAGRSTPWAQTCLRRVAGVERNAPYGKGA